MHTHAQRRPDPQQRLEQLGRVLGLARRHGTFWMVDGLEEREWAELQLGAVHRVERAYSRAKRKRQQKQEGGNGHQHQQHQHRKPSSR